MLQYNARLMLSETADAQSVLDTLLSAYGETIHMQMEKEYHWQKDETSFDLVSVSEESCFALCVHQKQEKEEICVFLKTHTAVIHALQKTEAVPKMVYALISSGLLREDGPLAVTAEPFELTDKDAQMACSLIMQDAGMKLPVLYISMIWLEQGWYVDPWNLARMMAGRGHVVCETSSHLSSCLLSMCGDKNPYNGAIALYFNDDEKNFIRWNPSDIIDSAMLERRIADLIREITSDIVLPDYDAVYVSMMQKSNKKLAEENEEICAAVEQELHACDTRIRLLQQRNDALQMENDGLHRKMSAASKASLLQYGREKDFYPNEISGIITDCLKEELERISPGSRRADVLKDIVDANEMQMDGLRQRKNTLRALLKGYREMPDSMKRSLNALGFEVRETSRHYRLTYYGDDRYIDTMSRTGSDSREGRNLASCLIRHVL